nr:lasso peptide biosynthesis B2 protein [Streptomyces sp. SID3343]
MEPAATWWRTLASTGDNHTAAVTANLSATEATGLTEALIAAGLLTLTTRPAPWPAPIVGHDPGPNWGTHTVPVALPHDLRPSLRVGAAACLSLVAVLTITHLGRRRRYFARHLTLARTITRWNALRRAPHADLDVAIESVRAVRYASRWCPTRAVCLEQSTAALVLLTLRGRSAAWCQGIAPDPVRLHAWIEHTGSGEPIDEPASTAAYTSVLRIPGRRSSSRT